MILTGLLAALILQGQPDTAFEDLVLAALNRDPQVRRESHAKLAKTPGAIRRLEGLLSRSTDAAEKTLLQEAIHACRLAARRNGLLDRLSEATRDRYRPLVERILSGNPAEVLELLVDVLPGFFGDPRREEFRIMVCQALIIPGEGPEWDRVHHEGLRLLRRGVADPESIDVAAGLLASPTPRTRADATYTLAHFGAKDRAEKIAPLLKDASAEVRREAIRALQELEATAHSEAVAALTKDSMPAVRAQAALALGRFGAARYSANVSALLDDRISAVRIAAIRALGAMQAAGLADRVAAILDDPIDGVRIEALEALASMGAVSQAPRIVQELRSASGKVRAKAAECLGRFAQPAYAIHLKELLRDSSAAARAAAIQALAAYNDPEYLSPIATKLEDRDSWVRRTALEALARLKGVAHAEAVGRRLADDPDPFVLTAALRAAGELGLVEQADLLLRLTRGENLSERFGPEVNMTMGDLIRAEAVNALGRVGSATHAASIEGLAGDPSPIVRRAAARALVRMTNLSRAPVLRKLLMDSDRSVSFEAATAINSALAPALSARVQRTPVPEGLRSWVLANHLDAIGESLGIRITSSPRIESLLKAPAAVEADASIEAALYAVARETDFELGYLLDDSGRQLMLMHREDVLSELRRALERR